MAQNGAIVPDKGIRPGYNETGIAIAENLAVQKAAGSAEDSIVLPGAGEQAIGVSMAAIADEERGDVQVDGQALATAGASFVRGAELKVTAAGKLITATSSTWVVAFARQAADDDGDIVAVEWLGLKGYLKA